MIENKKVHVLHDLPKGVVGEYYYIGKEHFDYIVVYKIFAAGIKQKNDGRIITTLLFENDGNVYGEGTASPRFEYYWAGAFQEFSKRLAEFIDSHMKEIK